MKITNISLVAGDSELANLSFRDPSSRNRYVVKGVFGLDADEINSVYYGDSIDGMQHFREARLKGRELVFRVALNPKFELGETYASLRDNMYKTIARSRTGLIDVHFNNGGATTAKVSGYVTKLEAALFNRDAEVQLTMKCDPTTSMLRAPERLYVDADTLIASTTLEDSLSTAPHGFKFQATIGAIAEVFVVSDSALTPTWQFVVQPGTIGASSGFLVGDVVYFSSEPNDKYFYIIRSSVTYQLVSKIWTGSKWPIMFPGGNDLEFRTLDLVGGLVPTTATKTYTWTEFSYYPTYWGI
jgi:hypothetical protein